MNAILTILQLRRMKLPPRWVRSLLAMLLLGLPMTVSAASWWCELFPRLCPSRCGAPLVETTAFGSNPGNLKMCQYLPVNLGASRPLVVALHGCGQQASAYDDETGWIKFADKYRFTLLLPQQQLVNNPSECFNWFEAGDNQRDMGEALSIRQMIGKVAVDAKIDPQRIYVTGLSGGGGMTAVMLAAYPEVFAGGAIIAGIPYKCANNASEALGQCGVSVSGKTAPMKDLTPAAWGTLVRNASSHKGPFPRVSIWQGTSDTTVNPEDQRELVDQWANVLGVNPQRPDARDMINGQEHKMYKDGSGKVLVETVLIKDMGHGTPIDPGTADDQCGKPAPFILDVGICSSFYILKFWGVEQP